MEKSKYSYKLKIRGFYFKLGFHWLPKQRSVIEIVKFLYQFFKELSAYDNRFNFPYFIINDKENFQINLSCETDLLDISKKILNYYKYDILSQDHNEDLNENYSREFGFSFSIGFKKEMIMLSGRLGSSEAEGLSFSFPRNFEEDFGWYLNLMKLCVKYTSSIYASLHLNVPSFTSIIKDIKYPLGLITFYSSQLPFLIKEHLSELQFEEDDTGVYIFSSMNEVTLDKEKFEEFKNMLLSFNNVLRYKESHMLRK